MFRRGVSVKENFDSVDLLQWLVKALVSSGAVDDNNKANMTEAGTSSVVVNGIGHKTAHNITYNNVQDFGVRKLNVVTRGITAGQYERVITYDLAREAYANNPEGFDAFFEKATPMAGTLTRPADAETAWTISFTADTAEEMVINTNTALGSTHTDFAVSVKGATGDGMTLETSIVDFMECSAICGEDTKLVSEFELHPGWDTNDARADVVSEDAMNLWAFKQSRDPIVFNHAAPFEKIVIDLAIAPGSESHARLSFKLSKDSSEMVGDALTKTLEPTSTLGKLDVNSQADAVFYTVTLEGDTSEELDSRMSQYIQGIGGDSSFLNIVELPAGGFSEAFRIDYEISLPKQLLSGGVTEGIEYTVSLPNGFSVNQSAQKSQLPAGTKIDGSQLKFTESSPSTVLLTFEIEGLKLIPLIITGLAILLPVTGVIVAIIVIRRRKKNASKNMPQNTLAPPPSR